MLWGYKLEKGHFLPVQSKTKPKRYKQHQTTKQRTGGEKMQLIRQSKNGNLLRNEKTGFFEVWNDGRRLFEISNTDEDSAVEVFRALAGETWEPTGEQGTK